mgnify:CR=1 FL=1
MIEVRTKLRRWGNSFGIVVPQRVINNGQIEEGDEIVVLLKKEEKGNVLKEMFGTFKFKRPTSKIMEEIDKELWDL